MSDVSVWYVLCLISDVWRLMSDVLSQTSGVRRLMSNVRRLMSDVRSQTSEVTCLISDVWCHMSDVRRLMYDVWYQTSDVTCLMSDVWCVICLMSNLGCLTSYVGRLMSNVWCQTCDYRRLTYHLPTFNTQTLHRNPPLFVFNGNDNVWRPTGSQSGRKKLQRKFSRTGERDPESPRMGSDRHWHKKKGFSRAGNRGSCLRCFSLMVFVP